MSIHNTESTRFNELQQLDSAIELLKSSEMKIGDIFESLGDVIRQTKSDILNLEKQKAQLQKEKLDLEKKTSLQERQLSGMTQDQMNLLAEYEEVKKELEKFTKMATSGGRINLENMRATLRIYSVLFEQVFANQPHFKIIYLLHGELEVMTLDQIKTAMGGGGVMILRACHELANADLIEFNTDTHKIKLKQRFYEKMKI